MGSLALFLPRRPAELLMPTPAVKTEALCCAVALLAGFGVGAANYVFERVGFELCRALEARGIVRRFVPTGGQFEEHPLSNLWAVGAPYTVLYYIAARFLWPGLSARMVVGFNPAEIWLFLWFAMAAHDAWFYSMHRLFHEVKPLFRLVHQRHHQNGSNVTALGTAFGDAADIGLCFVAFHGLLVLALWTLPRWNIVHVVALIGFEVATNITGHCGYELPLWLHAVVTAGVGLTPLAATSKTHYIHHLDPRFNKALYFTWCDRVAGSFRDTHRLIPGGEQEERKAA